MGVPAYETQKNNFGNMNLIENHFEGNDRKVKMNRDLKYAQPTGILKNRYQSDSLSRELFPPQNFTKNQPFYNTNRNSNFQSKNKFNRNFLTQEPQTTQHQNKIENEIKRFSQLGKNILNSNQNKSRVPNNLEPHSTYQTRLNPLKRTKQVRFQDTANFQSTLPNDPLRPAGSTYHNINYSKSYRHPLHVKQQNLRIDKTKNQILNQNEYSKYHHKYDHIKNQQNKNINAENSFMNRFSNRPDSKSKEIANTPISKKQFDPLKETFRISQNLYGKEKNSQLQSHYKQEYKANQTLNKENQEEKEVDLNPNLEYLKQKVVFGKDSKVIQNSENQSQTRNTKNNPAKRFSDNIDGNFGSYQKRFLSLNLRSSGLGGDAFPRKSKMQLRIEKVRAIERRQRAQLDPVKFRFYGPKLYSFKL